MGCPYSDTSTEPGKAYQGGWRPLGNPAGLVHLVRVAQQSARAVLNPYPCPDE